VRKKVKFLVVLDYFLPVKEASPLFRLVIFASKKTKSFYLSPGARGRDEIPLLLDGKSSFQTGLNGIHLPM
jgi:hypothetical protein